MMLSYREIIGKLRDDASVAVSDLRMHFNNFCNIDENKMFLTSVDVDASVDQRPDQDVGEEVLEDEGGHQLLLVQEVDGLAPGLPGEKRC